MIKLQHWVREQSGPTWHPPLVLELHGATEIPKSKLW